MASYPCRVTIKKKEGRLLKSGGSWIFDNEIESTDGTFENGDIVSVFDFDGYPLGAGFINMNSKIRIRMMTRSGEQKIDDAFLSMRLKNAWEYRKKTVDTSCCRILFGEADFMPGLTVDKFSDILVVESLSLGMDRIKVPVLELLKKILREDGVMIRGVYERSDSRERIKEGMDRTAGFIGEEFDTEVPITENGIEMIVDVKNGQKTGYFLDQKNNRMAIRSVCRDARVLDCFTHTGSFALNAGMAGAKEVLGADASETGILQAEENAKRNHLEDKVRFRVADIFELLPELEKQHERYDVVILDPPAFTKSKNTIRQAVKGYREINLRGMKLLKDGGYLATCSCSHYMDEELFKKTIHEAAAGAQKRLRQAYFSTQAPDHPILWAADETYYLKFFIFQVCNEK